MYGYRKIQTPALDALRQDSLLFERAYSHSPLTLPSHGTILTGLLPADHGVRDNVGFRMEAPAGAHLAETLRSRGYATAAAISAYVLRAVTGIDRGFDVYDDDVERGAGNRSLGAVQRSGIETAAIARSWIAANAGRPFFYFLHLYEPHAPYEAPSPHRDRYRDPYDAEIAHTDAILAGFFDFLKERGIYDRALIVLLSDHGEGLGDHGEEEHGIFLYREAIQVPLLFKLPGSHAPEIIRTPVGLSEVAPMILAALDGGDVKATKARPIYSETWYPRFHFGWSDLHSIIDGDEHYIEAPRPELFDLAADPGERRNILSERRRRAFAHRATLSSFRREARAPSPIDAEEAEKLAALGYVGSAAVTTGTDLADPKDKTGTFRELREAFRLYRARQDEPALRLLDRILENEPNMIDVWDVRSKILFRLGRIDAAIESGKEALRRSPGSTHLALDLANALLLAGSIGEAEEHARLAVKSDPARAHELLGRVHLLRGDLAGAEREIRASLAANESHAALYTLARIAQKRGELDDALEITGRLRASLERTGGRPLRGLHALRGDALARLGRDREAEAAFREELRLFPGDPEAYRGLIVLLASTGRIDEATRTVNEFARVAPSPATYRVIAQTLEVLGDAEGARYWAQRGK